MSLQDSGEKRKKKRERETDREINKVTGTDRHSDGQTRAGGQTDRQRQTSSMREKPTEG